MIPENIIESVIEDDDDHHRNSSSIDYSNEEDGDDIDNAQKHFENKSIKQNNKNKFNDNKIIDDDDQDGDEDDIDVDGDIETDIEGDEQNVEKSIFVGGRPIQIEKNEEDDTIGDDDDDDDEDDGFVSSKSSLTTVTSTSITSLENHPRQPLDSIPVETVLNEQTFEKGRIDAKPYFMHCANSNGISSVPAAVVATVEETDSSTSISTTPKTIFLSTANSLSKRSSSNPNQNGKSSQRNSAFSKGRFFQFLILSPFLRTNKEEIHNLFPPKTCTHLPDNLMSIFFFLGFLWSHFSL